MKNIQGWSQEIQSSLGKIGLLIENKLKNVKND